MHDIKAIRDDRQAYAAALSRRPAVDGAAEVAKVLELDAEVRAAILKKEAAEQARNARSKEIGKAKAAKDEALAARLMEEVAAAKAVIEAAGAKEAEATAKRDDVLARLPNIPLESVPFGEDERANVEVRVWDGREQPKGHRPSGLRSGARLNQPKDHADLGEALGMMDFEAAARMSGARFVVLKGQLARLERALTQFMLDVQTAPLEKGGHGYSETSVPLLVREQAMYGTGQLPKFEEDLFSTKSFVGRPAIETWRDDLNYLDSLARARLALIERDEAVAERLGTLAKEFPEDAAQLQAQFDAEDAPTAEGVARTDRTLIAALARMQEMLGKVQSEHYLIPTAEVSLTNIVREQVLDESQLPMRMTAATPCFRSEAGSAGRDTKGMIRQHQFIKVELVSIVKPEDSEAELERMTGCAEDILKRLDLPHRTVMLCTGDMGFGARKTYDIEVWLPSQDTYREISSCSMCGDFQARRMEARFKRAASADKPKPKPEYVHTLNGSGLAVGRALVAVLENYQREDGTIEVPKALVPYMGGVEVIRG